MPVLTTNEKDKYDAYETNKVNTSDYDKTTIDGMGIDAATINNGLTVQTSVPLNAKFTDTIYDDSTTVKSEPTGSQTSVLRMVGITQADYDALTPDAQTLYVITG